jgi:FAD/FMN-containing dehydrogenase
MLNDTIIGTFKATLRGGLIQRSDADYEEARKLYNGMIDKRPLMIARCVDTADVIHAVRFGRENNLLTAIRGGGHNGPGLGSCNDGLVIDLSLMKGVRVDPANRTVRVAGGCTQGDVDPDPAKAQALKEWGRGYWEAVHPFNLVGAYVNFMMDEAEGRIRSTYGDNYDRLVDIKKKFDSTNFFRVNQNIKPA